MTRRYIGKIDIYKRGATMKKVGIHVLDYNGKIIDFISQDDGAILAAEMNVNEDDKTNTFDFTIKNERSENLRKRNKIIVQDQNGVFHEYVIVIVDDTFEKETTIKCNASYLEDLKTAKPIPPGKLEANTTTQALLTTLADTGWEVSDETEYGGNRSTSWTAYTTPYDLINMLCTTYDMVADYYIELGSHEVEHRYVKLSKPNNLFKGKEIEKGKDLTNMTRTIDMSEVVTALIALSPEGEDGNRTTTVIKDDEAQAQFGLPGRYIWDVYEPESDDENMTLKRLTTLAKTEMNKRNKSSVSYEVSSVDISKFYSDVVINIRDIVRVKDRDFNPPLYIETEVVGVVYDWLDDVSDYKFGTVKEYEEKELRAFFNNKLDEITKKLNDTNSNIDTIVTDTLNDTLEYYERKIFKGDEPPENPKDDTLWYDTTNPNVAVLRRYHNGEWINETVSNVKQIGGVTREQALYSELKNSFINLGIQHSKLDNEVSTLLSSEYLVDEEIKNNLTQSLFELSNTYSSINSNLNSINEETATIGFLIDTQQLFMTYRQQLHELNRAIKTAQYAIDQRLKLLQSQYTDEKFNEAMTNIANTLPNGQWDANKQVLLADIPNKDDVEKLKNTLQNYTDGQINNLSSVLGKEIDSKINTSESKLSASISSVEQKIDGIEVGGRNLIRNSEKITDYIILSNVEKAGTYSLGFEPHFTENIPSEFGLYYGGNIDTLTNDKQRITHTFEVSEDRIGKDIRLFFGGTYTTHKDYINNGYVGKVKLEYGNVATDWTPAPEDIEDKILNSKQEAEEAAKTYANAQDELKQTEIQAYADGIVSDEEKRAIADAITKRDEAKEYADQKAQEAQEAANQNTSNQLEPITTRVTKNETNITELDSQISAMAKSDDVEQKLRDVDGRLTPLETTVNSNKATLDILPTQIESKVSKEDYTLDKNEIVQRLDNADSQRKQLSNEITDKITFVEFNSGMDATTDYLERYSKNYADNIKKETEKYTDNQINNLDVGSENLLLDSERRSDFTTYTGYSYTRYYLTQPLEIGKTYTLKADIVITDERQSGKTSIFPYNPSGTRDTVDIKDGKITYTFTAKVESTEFLIYKDVAGQSNADLNVTIEKAILVEGDKVTGWTPANQDVKRQIQQSQQEAEKSAKAYADAQDNLQFVKAKAYADDKVTAEEQRAIADAESKLETAKQDAQTKADAAKEAAQDYALAQAKTAQQEAEKAAKAYADAQDNLKETKIKAYADGIVSEEEKRAIADAENKLEIAKADAQNKASAAQTAAQDYAEEKANAAEEAAKEAAQNYADAQDELKETKIKAYADGIVSDEEKRAIQDAESKLEEAKTHAEKTSNAAQTAAQTYAQTKANTAETNAKNDATTKANKAEANAKAYTDAYKQNNDVAMTKLETSVSQLDGKVSIKVDEQKFNASQKTLSKVLTEIAATTSGINLTYDNNGTIQGVTVDNGGVKLRGDKVDITVNDAFRVMANRVSNVQTDVSNKVGKDEIINRLNLSPEGLDINVNNIGIRGGDSVDYLDIRNNSILSYGVFTRTWANETDTANLRLGIQGGTVKIQNRTTGYNLYLTEKGLSTMLAGAGDETAGTLEFHSTKYNDTSRGVRLHSTYGAVALESDYSRIILNANLTVNIESNYGIYFRPFRDNRTGNNEFAMYVKQNDSGALTDGVIKYGNVSSETSEYGSGLRFSKSSVKSTIYATNKDGDIGTGDFYGDKIFGDLTAKGTNVYVLVDNELRITDKKGYNNGNVNYKDLRANSINTTHSYAFANHSGSDVYFGVGYHELRITANNFWNGGNPAYQNIRFGKWYAMSSEKFKYDIKEWNYSVLDAYRNDLKLYSYKYKSEKDSKYIRNHHGVIIERELPIEWRHGDGFDGNEVMFWNAKAIQEIISEQDKLKKENEDIKNKYKNLEKEVEELKSLIKKDKK